MLRRLLPIFLFVVVSIIPATAQNAPPSTDDLLHLMPHALSPMPLPQGRALTEPAPPATEVPKNLVELAEKCLGQYQCLHEWLHQAYSTAFPAIDCHCYTGRCRPTTYKQVPVSPEYPMGVAIWANDRWCPVTAQAFRRNVKIPMILRQFKAHVCIGDHGCDELECAILGTDG